MGELAARTLLHKKKKKSLNIAYLGKNLVLKNYATSESPITFQ